MSLARLQKQRVVSGKTSEAKSEDDPIVDPKQLNSPASGHTKKDGACMRVLGQELCGQQPRRRQGMLQSQLKQPESQGQSQPSATTGGKRHWFVQDKANRDLLVVPNI